MSRFMTSSMIHILAQNKGVVNREYSKNSNKILKQEKTLQLQRQIEDKSTIPKRTVLFDAS